ncbi:alpha/beta fold hydrolase [Pseudonocardia spinosispora]|uniref:alpha/beta fold hydrolase n=1 Tax=Pseudonocardia spinosispora TaxID=103441 RepID=UPI001FE21793|nr:hypothetical protein [Pseudonocardia spinosispora]
MREFARDVAAVTDAESVERAAVVGHSLGGAVAVELAHLHPDLARNRDRPALPFARYRPEGSLHGLDETERPPEGLSVSLHSHRAVRVLSDERRLDQSSPGSSAPNNFPRPRSSSGTSSGFSRSDEHRRRVLAVTGDV